MTHSEITAIARARAEKAFPSLEMKHTFNNEQRKARYVHAVAEAPLLAILERNLRVLEWQQHDEGCEGADPNASDCICGLRAAIAETRKALQP